MKHEPFVKPCACKGAHPSHPPREGEASDEFAVLELGKARLRTYFTLTLLDPMNPT